MKRPPTRPAALVLFLIPAMVSPAVGEDHQVQVGGTYDRFTPADLTIQVGDTVTWSNVGGPGDDHNVSADDGSFRCANGCDGQGGNGDPSTAAWSFTLSFDTEGTTFYHCEVHGAPGDGTSRGPGMTGSITVESSAPPADNGDIRFTRTSFSEDENGGNAVVRVERVSGSDGAVSIDYDTSDGSATASQDYTAASGTLMWTDGETGVKTFTVAITDDLEPEDDETVMLTLSNPQGGAALVEPTQATLTIQDNDQASPGTLQLTESEFMVGEAEGTASVSVGRSGGSQGSVSVDVELADGSAQAGADYTAVGDTLEWGDGDAADKVLEVPILDDMEFEGDETVDVTLSDPTGGANLGMPSQATLTINDNEAVPPCEDSQTAVCLLDRFLVTVVGENQSGTSGDAPVDKLTDSAAAFEFPFLTFEEGNIEIVIKMKSGCDLPEGNPLRNFWIFIAGLTNVRVEITIVDTVAGTVRQFFNALGEPFFTPASDSPHGQATPPGSIQATTEGLGALPTCDVMQ